MHMRSQPSETSATSSIWQSNKTVYIYIYIFFFASRMWGKKSNKTTRNNIKNIKIFNFRKITIRYWFEEISKVRQTEFGVTTSPKIGLPKHVKGKY